jgi:fructokinase
MAMHRFRIGVDLGGTKIEAVVMERGGRGRVVTRRRVATPRGDYVQIVNAVARLVTEVTQPLGVDAAAVPVGVGIPGTISPATGLVKNANTNELIGHALDQDLERALGRSVRLANDANCFALSESVDGAVARAGLSPERSTVFGVILGTGVGGGLVVRGEIVSGPDQIAGEWGHNPLPWMTDSEFPGETCWCGKRGCIEGWLAGPALALDHARVTSEVTSAPEIATRATQGDAGCLQTIDRYCDRLARGLASVVNILNPDAIVLGGGVSNISKIYETVPKLLEGHAFSDRVSTLLVPAFHGDSSGVRGAAWLWG